MKILLHILLSILTSSLLHGQTFVGTSTDKTKSYNCTIRINKDSTINFIYNKNKNVIYGEHIGNIKRINDSLFHISATMSLGQFYMKSFNNDTTYVAIDSNISRELDKISIQYSNGTQRHFAGYNKYGKPIALLKIPIDKKIFNKQKGKNFITIIINRKNILSDNFLSFEIPFGSSVSFTKGLQEDFFVVVKNGQLYTVKNAPLQTGHFKLNLKNHSKTSIEKSIDVSSKTNSFNSKIKLYKLDKLSVVGDFDGDGKQDTIFQHNYSRINKAEIEYSADPFQNEWDTVVKWFYDQDADLYLTLYKGNQGTLHLGTAQGLYCLINIGDNNADGKDEIALVIDYLDYSRVNSCKIYTLCQGKWTLLKQFGVYEGSFDFTTDKAPNLNNIKDYLEKQNGKWVYKDYSQDSDDKQEDNGIMKTLKLERCK